MKFKAGLEIHFQLNTRKKLFCNCSTSMGEKQPSKVIVRKQHPVASELGEIDKVAQYEFLRNRTFNYQMFNNETCLVEADEEPPHPLNREALEIALQIATLMKCEIPNEIQVMRKSVIDGSNPSSFQRTMIVGYNGELTHKGRKVPITQITLEEDAAANVKEEDGTVTFRLNRLGVPLVEIDTGILEGFTTQDVQDIALSIGTITKSTGKIKRGIGSIRQDLNVSTKGDRVELKGVQELGMLAKAIEIEIKRQMSLDKIERETRGVNENGESRFMRPLPGAARMYPETDIPPVSVDKKMLSSIKKNLPELLTKKFARLKSSYKLSDTLLTAIMGSDYLDVFEEVVRKTGVEPTIAANTFVSVIKDLERREKLDVSSIDSEDYTQIFEAIAKGKLAKEALPTLIKHMAMNTKHTVQMAIKELGLESMSDQEIEKIVKEISTGDMPEGKLIGLVMSKVRGKADPQNVIKIVKKFTKK